MQSSFARASVRTSVLTALTTLALVLGLLLVAPSGDAARRVPVTVAAKASTTSAPAGTDLTVRGRVSRPARKAVVVLQRRAGRKWVRVEAARVGKARRYALRTSVVAGRSRYRVKVRRTARTRAAVSKVLRVRGVVLAPAPAPTPEPAPDQAAIDTILRDTNAHRKAHGKAPLQLSVPMTTVARDWSRAMATTGEFKHNPNYARQIPSGWTRAAENIAAGQSVGDVVAEWMKSPGHRDNILGDFTHLGIGFVSAPGTRYARYYTQVFAKY